MKFIILKYRSAGSQKFLFSPQIFTDPLGLDSNLNPEMLIDFFLGH